MQSESKHFFLVDFGPLNRKMTLKNFFMEAFSKYYIFFRVFEVAPTFLNIYPFRINRFGQTSTQNKGK